MGKKIIVATHIIAFLAAVAIDATQVSLDMPAEHVAPERLAVNSEIASFPPRSPAAAARTASLPNTGTAAASAETAVQPMRTYPVHTGITATVFWIGEPEGAGSSENNAISAWDDKWQEHYGGYDDFENRDAFMPSGFVPRENPFYLDLPYNDFNDDGDRKPDSYDLVPWANEKEWGETESMMKNRWVRIDHGSNVCYGQIEDSGPYEYDDADYVFGDSMPKNDLANAAGMDVSPALRDCLGFDGENNDENRVDWQFVDDGDVPPGPWNEIVTVSGTTWE